jgi:hypothetical protein
MASSLGKLNDVKPEPALVVTFPPKKISSGKLSDVKVARLGNVKLPIQYFKSEKVTDVAGENTLNDEGFAKSIPENVN